MTLDVPEHESRRDREERRAGGYVMRRSSRTRRILREQWGPFLASAMFSRSNRDTAVVAYAAATASAVPSRRRIFITRLTQYTFAPVAAKTTTPGSAQTSDNT
jgi:hypothetical protein